MVTQAKDLTPKTQSDLFKSGARDRNASSKLKSLVLGSSEEEFYGLPAAAEAVSLSQDTLRRAIAKGDLVAKTVLDHGREVYEITKSDLSAYLLWRGLPRREQERLREERMKRATRETESSNRGSRPTPLQIELRSKLAGREHSARDALRVVAARPSSLMRGVRQPDPVPPRASVPAATPTTEDRIVALIEYAKELELGLAEVRGALSDLLVQHLSDRRLR